MTLGAPHKRTRVVVVDDSPTSLELLTELCRDDPEIEVVGRGTTGGDAIELVRTHRPSIVVMDIEMPGMDGFEATRHIMSTTPTPIMIVTAKQDPRDVAVSLRALQVGALTVQPKPRLAAPSFASEAAQFVSLVKALAEVKVVRHHNRGQRAEAGPGAPEAPLVRHRQVRAVGVAASTGGPAALRRFLGALPDGLDVPVMVVQHIAAGFVTGLVSWLASVTPLPVKLAQHGEPLRAGVVYVAPDDAHLAMTRRGTVDLAGTPPVGGFRPSASVLFSSMARAHGERCAAVVLTGMGSDGLAGACDVSAAGGLVLAQDETSCAVFGMPRVVADAGLADGVGPVEELAVTVAAHSPIRRK